MPKHLPLLLLAGFAVFCSALRAQNVNIEYQNPAAFAVCGTAAFSVTIKNNEPDLLTALTVRIELPAGVSYVAGSVANAAESNISDLSAPVFALPDLPAGSSKSFTLTQEAGCAAVAAINSGLLFTNTITASFAGGNQQITTQAYPVETGLLLITSVSPPALTGEKGQVLTRTIKVRNTRQGAIPALRFSDKHLPGIDIALAGVGGTNIAGSLFEADVPGSFFTGFGDGDALLEFNEEVVLTEQITVTDCGPLLIPSDIRVGWGCAGNICQPDSTVATVNVKPSTQNPALAFYPKYAPPQNQCAETPAIQELLIVNTGPVPAEYVNLSFLVLDTLLLGMDIASFQINTSAGWSALAPAGGVTQNLPACDSDDFYKLISLKTPLIPPGDSVYLRFNTYLCQAPCGADFAQFGAAFSYPLACPQDSFVSGGFQFEPAIANSAPVSKVYYNIGQCLDNNGVYALDYWIRSGRLFQSSGYLQVVFDLPWGLYWEDNCFQNLGGKSPLSVEKSSIPGISSQVRVTFALPFNQDSVSADLCLRYVCSPDLPCQSGIPSVPPRGADYMVFPPGVDCVPCDLEVRVQSYFLPELSSEPACVVSACDAFILSVNDVCGAGGGGGGNGGGGGGFPDKVSVEYDAYRLNLGLRDDNDDRLADNNTPPTLSKIRRDRFLTGDTLRTELKAVVLQGTLDGLDFRQFHEAWASDFGIADGDTFFLPATKLGFTNYDTTRYLGGRIILKIAATGAQFECAIPTPGERSDMHIFTIAEPNIRPYVVLDRVASMFNRFKLFAAGCLPTGSTLTAGDTLLFIADYQLQKNFVPSSPVIPPLVNFRSGVCVPNNVYAWKLHSCLPPKLLQFSGYIQDIQAPQFAIQPCEDSKELSPFGFSLRIARQNLFPFEVRPLATALDYTQVLPQGVPLLDTRLKFLRLQENKLLFGEQVLTPVLEDNFFRLDLSPFFNKPLDEGFAWQISSRFGPFCQYSNSNTATTNVVMQYASEAFHWPVTSNFSFPNFNGYLNGSPKLLLGPPGLAIDLSLNLAVVNLSLSNYSNYPALNVWLALDANGALDNPILRFMPSGAEVPRLGGLWQIGAWPSGNSGKEYLQLIARNRSCAPNDLRFQYGWDCSPVTNIAGDICGVYDTLVQLRPQPSELELVVENEPSPAPMCAPSEWFEFQVYNANTGYAYGLTPSVKLPPGLRVAAGSSLLAYPENGPFLPLPNPALLPGNVWQWDPQAASPALAQVGLAGFDKAPFHAFRIRFRVEALCGAVSNAQFIYRAEGRLPCGVTSNVLRKPGDPVLIGDLEPTYGVTAQLDFANPPGNATCGGTTELVATLSTSDAPSPGDSIYIVLPPGILYVAGSYQPVSNAPAESPAVAGQTLRWAIPPDLAAGATLRFRLSIRYDDPADCADQIVVLQTREQAQAFCPLNGQNCDVFVATGETFLTLHLENPELTVRDFEPVFQNGQFHFNAILENAGAGTAVNPLVEFYLDQNQNGLVDAADSLLTTVQLNQALPPGSASGLFGALDIQASDLCRLLAYVPGAENCACSDQVIPLGGNAFTTTAIGLCEILPVQVGVDSLSGSTYTWLTPNGLACTGCAQTVFMPEAGVLPGTVTTLILRENAGSCIIEHRFDIRIGGAPGLETPDQTVCRGETVRLEATAGGTYQWSGPGISNPTAGIQFVQPAATAAYSVTVTFAGGCTGAGTVKVTVLESDSIDLGALTTCAGEPVQIFGNLTEEPGLYTLALQKSNGCDSVLYVRLHVTPTLTVENRPLCPGASTLVFDSLFTQPGNLCMDFVTATGCDSTHCVIVKAVPAPQLPVPDTVIIENGQKIQLMAKDGFVLYQWSPPGALSCADCPDPIANPDSSSTYRLTVTDGNGCTATIEYRILVFPPCDPQRLLVPNAFTPDGDGNNDVFKVVPFEGFEMVHSLVIYNRWGQRIYAGSGPKAGWDGTVDGKPAPADVYVWILQADCGGVLGRLVGDVALIR